MRELFHRSVFVELSENAIYLLPELVGILPEGEDIFLPRRDSLGNGQLRLVFYEVNRRYLVVDHSSEASRLEAAEKDVGPGESFHARGPKICLGPSLTCASAEHSYGFALERGGRQVGRAGDVGYEGLVGRKVGLRELGFSHPPLPNGQPRAG